MPVRLTYFVDRPIQYQAPLLRRIAALPELKLRVVFRELGAAAGTFDPGFQQDISWDVPVLDGYEHDVLPDTAEACRALLQADVIWMHGWQGQRMLKILSSAHRAGKPVLMRGENTLAAMPPPPGPKGWLKKRYLDWIFERVSVFLTIGSDNAAYYRAHGVGPEKMVLMPYAVDNEYFAAQALAAAQNQEALRRSIGIASDNAVILYAGKLQRRKKPDALLDAFLKAQAEPDMGPSNLIFVGDGELRAELEAKASGHSNIHILGFKNQSELPAFYDLADVFVLASEREPWGLAVNEAMNAGTAIIASHACGCAADLISEACGRVVPPSDRSALAEALNELLHDRAKLDAAKQAARDKVSTWGFEQDIEGLLRAVERVSPQTSRQA